MFKKLHCTFVFILIATYSLFSQNLVYNGSFEQYDTCPQYNGRLNLATYWFSANWGGGGSSEYFNSCANPGVCGVPNNFLGGFQYARTGNGYTGTSCYNNIDEYREYIEGTLNTKLLSGRDYCMSFYISLSDYSTFGIDALGVFFTTDSLITHSELVYSVTPQISNIASNIIVDNSNWVKISGTFTASGGENYFTFGNFKNRNQTDTIRLLPQTIGHSYYLLDDVAVYKCDAPIYFADAGGDHSICMGESVQLSMQKYNEYEYKWFTLDGTLLDTTSYVTVSPNTTTSYVLWVKDFKYDITSDTVKVIVDEDCNRNPIVYIPNIFSPNNDGQNDKLYVRGQNLASLHLIIYNRWGNQVYESNDINEGWDGTQNSKPCETGVYVYRAEVVFKNGQTVEKRGNVTLVR